MAEPLFRLAEHGRLPDHQVMDIDTLRWIANGVLEEWKAFEREKIPYEIRISFEFPSSTEDLFPSLDMFQVPALFRSIHGTRHAARVGLFSHWVAGVCNVPLDLLQMAALFHDVRAG